MTAHVKVGCLVVPLTPPRAGSILQSNDSKSVGTKVHDFSTPGNDSGAEAKTKGVGETVAQMAVDAKDAVVGAFSSDASKTGTTGTGATH